MRFNEPRQKILETVNIVEVINRYTGATVSDKIRCVCPIHRGKNKNLQVYPDNNSFYCFKCGAGGDVINFVANFFGISYSEAMKKLDRDYSLGVFEKQHRTYAKYAKQHIEHKRQQLESDINRALLEFQNDMLTRYFKWLHKQPENDNVLFDIAHVERLLDSLLAKNKPLDFDIKAHIRALHEKHKER